MASLHNLTRNLTRNQGALMVAIELSNTQARFEADCQALRLQLEELEYDEDQITGDMPVEVDKPQPFNTTEALTVFNIEPIDKPAEEPASFSTILHDALHKLKAFPAEYERFCQSYRGLELMFCEACNDYLPESETLLAPCGDRYCAECLTMLFESAMNDESMYPPRCCAQIIPLASVRSTITEELAVAFTEKAIEFDTVDRTYCSDPNCATFIPADVILNDIATCGNCGMTTCAICKAASHLNDCPQDENIRALLQQAEEMQWQRCSECLRIVQRDTGCNHISCRCGAEFCYVCGEPYNGLGDHPCADGNRWERNPFYKLYQLPRDVVEPEGDASPSPEPDTEL
ncbi:hypothetical protein D6C85_08251 [Aureobasidium pullulans]|uniref:RBR-type E3 ubiquitin transferase n=1 Tax=Aureobasidium pullulans TaxID=5580 RepID=A0A4S9Z0W9_AURPU|nr:hypothetical protein D6C85_08251 [Aureobasidium pullulans]TIA00091.1 hypothetical protein D6C82_04753 [Aureobasidium pullulans]